MISVYLRNEDINPSCYYRIKQYIDDLPTEVKIRSLNTNKLYNTSLNSPYKAIRKIVQAVLFIQLNFNFLMWSSGDIKNENVVLVQREIIPRVCLPIIKKRLHKLYSTCRIIWDFDDNIRSGGELTQFEYELLLQNANDIIVTNSNLTKLIENKACGKIHEIPTTDGTIFKNITKELIEERFEVYDSKVNLVWVGTSGNINEVQRIIPYIEQAAKIVSNKKLVLTIISGNNPQMHNSHFEIRFVKWNREAVKRELITSHIGIMPLKDNEYNRGKGGFKLIQYLSASLPIIGSDVGINKEIITENVGKLISNNEEWTNSIINLATNKDEYVKMTKKALELWKDKYSSEMVASKLREIVTKE